MGKLFKRPHCQHTHRQHTHTASTHTLPAHTLPAHTLPAHTLPAHTPPAHTPPAHALPVHSFAPGADYGRRNVAVRSSRKTRPRGTDTAGIDSCRLAGRLQTPCLGNGPRRASTAQQGTRRVRGSRGSNWCPRTGASRQSSELVPPANWCHPSANWCHPSVCANWCQPSVELVSRTRADSKPSELVPPVSLNRCHPSVDLRRTSSWRFQTGATRQSELGRVQTGATSQLVPPVSPTSPESVPPVS
jgi:hypothetical protein